MSETFQVEHLEQRKNLPEGIQLLAAALERSISQEERKRFFPANASFVVTSTENGFTCQPYDNPTVNSFKENREQKANLSERDWEMIFSRIRESNRVAILTAIKELGNNWVSGADIQNYLSSHGGERLIFAFTDFGINPNLKEIGFQLETRKIGKLPTRATDARFQIVKISG